jgi:hypothetical protein
MVNKTNIKEVELCLVSAWYSKCMVLLLDTYNNAPKSSKNDSMNFWWPNLTFWCPCEKLQNNSNFVVDVFSFTSLELWCLVSMGKKLGAIPTLWLVAWCLLVSQFTCMFLLCVILVSFNSIRHQCSRTWNWSSNIWFPSLGKKIAFTLNFVI